jgi:hypothetical protein
MYILFAGRHKGRVLGEISLDRMAVNAKKVLKEYS